MKRFGLMLALIAFIGIAVSELGLFKSVIAPGIAQASESAAEATKVEAEEEHQAKPKDSGIPYKAMVAAAAMAFCAFATALAQMKIGSAAMGTIAEKPDTAPMCIVMLAIPETIVILGFVVGAMIIMF